MLVVASKAGNRHVRSVQSGRSGVLTETAVTDLQGMMRQSGRLAMKWVGDVVQQSSRDSSPPHHEFRRDSNPPARSPLHAFIITRFEVKWASKFLWSSLLQVFGLIRTSGGCTKGAEPLSCSPEPVRYSYRKATLQEAHCHEENWSIHVKGGELEKVSLNLFLPCNWFKGWWSQCPQKT